MDSSNISESQVKEFVDKLEGIFGELVSHLRNGLPSVVLQMLMRPELIDNLNLSRISQSVTGSSCPCNSAVDSVQSPVRRKSGRLSVEELRSLVDFRGRKICTFCNKAGHVRKSCKLNLNHVRKSRPAKVSENNNSCRTEDVNPVGNQSPLVESLVFESNSRKGLTQFKNSESDEEYVQRIRLLDLQPDSGIVQSTDKNSSLWSEGSFNPNSWSPKLKSVSQVDVTETSNVVNDKVRLGSVRICQPLIPSNSNCSSQELEIESVAACEQRRFQEVRFLRQHFGPESFEKKVIDIYRFLKNLEESICLDNVSDSDMISEVFSHLEELYPNEKLVKRFQIVHKEFRRVHFA